MPIKAPGWFEDLPVFVTEAEYRDLPENISRSVEIVHGHMIRCERPAPRRNRIARRLANALETARSPAGPCLTVETDVDVVLWRVPRFTFRRPDVAVYRCIDDPSQRPGVRDTLLVIEVTSPTTAREDLVDKKAQYATAGIPLYVVVVLDEKYDIAEVREFHLDAAVSAYRLFAVHRSVLELEEPVRISLPLADLVAG
jgi:Uma2 family endonuclease